MSVGVSYPVARPVERLRGVVDDLAQLDPVELSDGALAGELVALRREMDRQEAVFAAPGPRRACPGCGECGWGGVDRVVATAPGRDA